MIEAQMSKTNSISNTLSLATFSLQRGDLAAASKHAAVGILDSASNCGPHAWSFHFIHAEVLRMQGNLAGALTYLRSLKASPDKYEESQVSRKMHIGYCLALLGHHVEARSLLVESLTMAQQLNSIACQLEVKARLAMLEFLQDNLAVADSLYSEVSQDNGWYLHCVGLCGRGKIALHKKMYPEAMGYLEAAKGVAEYENAPLIAAGCQSEIALCLLALGDPEKALQLLRNAERVTWNLGALHLYGIILGDLGNVYLMKKDYWTAIPYYQRALNLALQIKDPAKIYNWSHNIRIAYGKFRMDLQESS